MKKFLPLIALALCLCRPAAADTLDVKSFRFAGPFPVSKPYMIDTVNIAGKSFDLSSFLDKPVSFAALKDAQAVSELPQASADALNLIGFSVENRLFAKASIKIDGLKHYQLYVDGKKQGGGELKLEPATHDFVIKYLSEAGKSDTLKVSIIDSKNRLSLRNDGKKIFSLDIDTEGALCGDAAVSASGKYLSFRHSLTNESGRNSDYYEILDAASGKVLVRTSDRIAWMPSSDAFWYTRQTVDGRKLICTDPSTLQETVLAEDLPQGGFSIAPTEDFLIFTEMQEGPKEGEVHQILTPDDRQPGWRNRSYISKYDLKTGILQPLTFGWHNSYLADISDDGQYILFETSRERLTERPTSLFSVYRMNLQTLEVECIIEDDGFLGGVQFSPDGKQVLVKGSPECLKGIGNAVKPGQTPNEFDYQLYVLTIADKSVKPITKDFNPSVQDYLWSRFDGKIYFYAEDKDCMNLYRINPKNGKAERLPNQEEYVGAFDIARTAPVLAYNGQSLCNGHRVWRMDTKTLKQEIISDAGSERLEDVILGEGLPYEFKSSKGDVINGFYVLPPDFDPSKKYPLLVHYYGGCSPSSRYCIGSYSPQMYASQGYIFYVVNPSGASGFGQEFAARHVNTAGDGVAEDIIEATERFCKDHPYVNSEKIGCFSASYGGFMTQLLLSKSDIYTTGISHAGISSHTSYWGEGYWGYSYSETSMANSYPWTRKDLYVDRSPIYFADKIHTPILFLHGSADTNVPIGESIQMFTAMKLLGTETAFVVVDGENHGISEFNKKRQWLRTIFAWFAKYLQDDDTWWNELYPEKNL